MIWAKWSLPNTSQPILYMASTKSLNWIGNCTYVAGRFGWVGHVRFKRVKNRFWNDSRDADFSNVAVGQSLNAEENNSERSDCANRVASVRLSLMRCLSAAEHPCGVTQSPAPGYTRPFKAGQFFHRMRWPREIVYNHGWLKKMGIPPYFFLIRVVFD